MAVDLGPSLVRVKRYASDQKLQERLELLEARWAEVEKERWKRIKDNQDLKARVKEIEDYAVGNLGDLTIQAVKSLKTSGWKVFTARTSKEAIEYMREIIQDGRIALVPSPETTEAAVMPGFALSNKVTLASLEYLLCNKSGMAPLHPLFPVPIATEEDIKRAEAEISAGLEASGNVIVAGSLASADGHVLVGKQEKEVIDKVINGAGDKAGAKHLFILVGIDRLVRSESDAGDVAKLLQIASGNAIALEKVWAKDGSHIIFLDNGRLALSETEYKDVLKCIHCYSCPLDCPVYKSLGNLYGAPDMGGVGVVLTSCKEGIKRGVDRGLHYCLLCARCSEECPMDIDIPAMVKGLRRKAEVSNL